jgi:hypothetical protein
LEQLAQVRSLSVAAGCVANEGVDPPIHVLGGLAISPDALDQMKVLRQRLAELGSDEIFMMDREPRGHKVTLVPEILQAMNAYLQARLH